MDGGELDAARPQAQMELERQAASAAQRKALDEDLAIAIRRVEAAKSEFLARMHQMGNPGVAWRSMLKRPALPHDGWRRLKAWDVSESAPLRTKCQCYLQPNGRWRNPAYGDVKWDVMEHMLQTEALLKREPSQLAQLVIDALAVLVAKYARAPP